MNRPVALDSFIPETDAFTRPELVAQYEACERHRERVRTSRRDWVDRIPLDDGRVEVRTYEAGRLVSREFVMPGGSAHGRTQRGTWGTRLA